MSIFHDGLILSFPPHSARWAVWATACRAWGKQRWNNGKTTVSNGGQFGKGNKAGAKSHGGGRPRNEERDALRAIIDANVSGDAVAAAFHRIESILLTGEPGWLSFFKEYMDRRYGKPDTYQALDITTGGEPLKGYMVVSPDDWPSE